MVERLQDDILIALKRTGATGLLIDVSSVEIIDSFTARSVINTARMAQLMDARTVVVGISPEVALTLVEMGFAWIGVKTALNVEQAIGMMEE
jgi:rsbT antagonist protein RsbS